MSLKIALAAGVAALVSASDSAQRLMNNLSEKLEAALNGGNTEAELQAIIDTLNSEGAELAAAVAANTPADPAVAAPGQGQPGGEPGLDQSASADGGIGNDTQAGQDTVTAASDVGAEPAAPADAVNDGDADGQNSTSTPPADEA